MGMRAWLVERDVRLPGMRNHYDLWLSYRRPSGPGNCNGGWLFQLRALNGLNEGATMTQLCWAPRAVIAGILDRYIFLDT